MSLSKQQRAVKDNLTDLSDKLKLNDRVLTSCYGRQIFTIGDRDDLENKREGFARGSHFAKNVLYLMDAGKFRKFYELSLEEDTKQSDDVLKILILGLDESSASNSASDLLKQYSFEDETCVDGTLFSKVKLDATIPLPSSNFPRYEIKKGKFALIVNITKFEGSQGKADRHGAEFDSKKMAETLKGFGFTVYKIEETVTAEKLENMTKAFKDKCKESGDTCIVVIMSHGDRDVILTSQNETLNIKRDILEGFNNINFEEFIGKPKLFFFQACRGQQSDGGTNKTMKDGITSSRWENLSESKLPSWTDMLVCYSTLEDQYSHRESNGSWFIQILCDKLKAFGASTDISKILTLVAEDMKRVVGSGGEKQICPWENIGFTKEFYF